jgi:hypothetical protein
MSRIPEQNVRTKPPIHALGPGKEFGCSGSRNGASVYAPKWSPVGDREGEHEIRGTTQEHGADASGVRAPAQPLCFESPPRRPIAPNKLRPKQRSGPHQPQNAAASHATGTRGPRAGHIVQPDLVAEGDGHAPSRLPVAAGGNLGTMGIVGVISLRAAQCESRRCPAPKGR